MQKLSVFVLERMMKSNLSSKEVDFILYVGRYQNEYGSINGIYYKDICRAIDVSVQGFYDCKKSLERKGIIKCAKNSYFDCDITILDNSFAGKENYGRGYVSLHCNMVRTQEFQQLKAGSKLMALWLMREWSISKARNKKASYQMLKETFINKFTELLNVSARVARSYLGELKPFLNIYLEKGRKYFLTFKHDMVTMQPGDDSENGELRKHEVVVACRRNRVKGETDQTIKELCNTLSMHHQSLKKLPISLSDIVADSLAYINDTVKSKYKWKRYLNLPLIHKLLVEQINVSMM